MGIFQKFPFQKHQEYSQLLTLDEKVCMCVMMSCVKKGRFKELLSLSHKYVVGEKLFLSLVFEIVAVLYLLCQDVL